MIFSQKSLLTLLETIHRDPDYVRSHTRLLIRAREWERDERRNSLLLRGDDLQTAEMWLTSGVNKDPAPTNLHANYIAASRIAQRRTQRMILAGVSIALVVALGLAILSFSLFQSTNTERQRADSNAAVAETNAAQALVAQAEAETQATVAFQNLTDAQNTPIIVPS